MNKMNPAYYNNDGHKFGHLKRKRIKKQLNDKRTPKRERPKYEKIR